MRVETEHIVPDLITIISNGVVIAPEPLPFSWTLQSNTTVNGSGTLAVTQMILQAAQSNSVFTLGAGQTMTGDFNSGTSGGSLSKQSVALVNHGTMQFTGVSTFFANAAGVTTDGNFTVQSGATVNSAAPISLSAGSMSIDGTLTLTAGATLTISGGTLGGSGVIAGPIVMGGGLLSPGHSPGSMTVGSFQLNAGTLLMDIAGSTPGVDCDQLIVTDGPLVLGGDLSLNLLTGTDFGVVYTLIDNRGTGSILGTFAGLPEGAIIQMDFRGSPEQFVISYSGGDGNDLVLTGLPEPGTLGLLTGAFFLLIRKGRRREVHPLN